MAPDLESGMPAVAGHPTLSIILVTKNRARFLERFFRNIDEQIKSCGFLCELIVVDGASTDGAVEIILEHQDMITWWVSEEDSGVSEAFNKALAMARGKIIKPVGDEDEFLPGAMSSGVEFLQGHPTVDCVVFHAQWMREEDSGERKPLEYKQQTGEMTIKRLLQFPYSGIITPESAFTRKEVFDLSGGYDLNFHLWAYLEIWLRQLKAGFKMVCVPEKIMLRMHTSDSDGTKYYTSPRWREEFLDVIRRYGGLRWVVWHKLDGDPTVMSLVRKTVRYISYKVFGTNPRAVFNRHRPAGS